MRKISILVISSSLCILFAISVMASFDAPVTATIFNEEKKPALITFIKNFSVNSSGDVAICFNNTFVFQDTILVYTKEGKFSYGISVESTNGMVIGVNFDQNDSMEIFFNRSNKVYSYSKEHDKIALSKEYESSNERNNVTEELREKKSITFADDIYCLKKSIFGDSIVKNPNTDNEVTVFSFPQSTMIITLISWAIISLIVVAGIIFLIHYAKKAYS